MKKPARVRLDQLLFDRGLVESRSMARALIMAGSVSVGGAAVHKAGTHIDPTAPVEIKEGPRFVSRAGEKLAGALEVFGHDPAGASALDVGASTGGFVDCLLQRGVARVIALDVGYGQLDARLRADERVFVLDRVNARHLTCDLLAYVPDLLTTDVSFISLEKVLPAVLACMAPMFTGFLLVKPQFEAGPRFVGKGGIVRDPVVHADVLRRVGRFLRGSDLAVRGLCVSGVPGAGGNVEFVYHVERGSGEGLTPATLEALIERVVKGGVSG